MPWIASLLDWLNRYANLLLVAITAVYAYLTWKTLKALERSNLREREAQHLADIKTQVVAPILQWLDFRVLETLRGRHEPVIVMTAIGHEPSPRAPRQLYSAVLQIDGLSNDLYEHAMREHFEALHKYHSFRELVAQFFGALAEFGNKCSSEIQGLTSLPRYTGDRTRSFVDCEGVVQFCLQEIVRSNEPRFYISTNAGVATVSTAYSGEWVAHGPDKEVQEWLDKSKELIEKSWNHARLRERIQLTLDDAEKLRDAIRQIELTYALPKPCKYTRD